MLDILFAKAHYIEDGHAVRSLDTRLGASFNLVLGFATVGLLIVVFYADRNTVESTSLVPSASLREVEHNGTKPFGSLNVTILTYAPSSSSSATARCEGSILRDFTAGLNCTSLATEEQQERSDVSVCRVEMSCATKSSSLLRGTQEVLFGLPDTFQTIEYYVTNSFWDDQVPPITIRSTLTPERRLPALAPARVLVGTKANPTMINIEATRSIRNDTRAGLTCDTRGLQLSWIDEQRVAAVDEGTAEGRHYVAVAFHVQSATYQRTLSDKLSPQNRFGLVLTYMLSVIAFLKIIKMLTQVLVDYMYGRLPLSKQPNDVLRRKRILNEHLLTKEGNRRLSMSVGGGGGKPEKQRRLSSRELMGQVQSKPKKQRRLSSRELMKEEKNKSTAVDIGIEMTSLGSGSRDEMMEYSNPLKRHSVDRGGRRRHSSASLGGLFVGTGGGGDKEEIQTLKNNIREMEIKFDQQLEETAQTLRQSAKQSAKQSARQMEQMEQMKQQINMLLAAASENERRQEGGQG